MWILRTTHHHDQLVSSVLSSGPSSSSSLSRYSSHEMNDVIDLCQMSM